MDTWTTMYNEVKNHVEQYKKIPACSGQTTIGRWMSNQKRSYKSGDLSVDRIKKLESLNGWSWNVCNDQWEKLYKEVKEYVQQKDRLPNKSVLSSSGVSLGVWIDKQIEAYANGTIQNRRQQLLEKIPHWKWDIALDPWGKAYMMLAEYVEKEKRIPSLDTKTKTGFLLGKWADEQKQLYVAKQLGKIKIKLLEEIPNWSWTREVENIYNGSRDVSWNNMYKKVQQYVKEKKQLPIDSIEYKMSTWVIRQKLLQNRRELENQKCALLEKIPNWKWSKSLF